MIFERIKGDGKPFAIDGTITDMMTVLWSVVEANNPGKITFEDFIEWLTDEPEELSKMMEWLKKELNKRATLGAKKKTVKKAKAKQ